MATTRESVRARVRRVLPLATAIVGAIAGLLSALALADRVRLVDIITLFAGGVGAGAGVVKAVVDARDERRRRDRHAAPGVGGADDPSS